MCVHFTVVSHNDRSGRALAACIRTRCVAVGLTSRPACLPLSADVQSSIAFASLASSPDDGACESG
jgi:hypothetical protein